MRQINQVRSSSPLVFCSSINTKVKVKLYRKLNNLADYLQKILNIKNVSEERLELIKKLYEDSVDFRSLNQLKAKLSELDKDNTGSVTLEDYQLYRDQLIKVKMPKSEQLLLKEISDGYLIYLHKLSDIVDLFNYLPVKVT